MFFCDYTDCGLITPILIQSYATGFSPFSNHQINTFLNSLIRTFAYPRIRTSTQPVNIQLNVNK